jgi:hypothetical protein
MLRKILPHPEFDAQTEASRYTYHNIPFLPISTDHNKTYDIAERTDNAYITFCYLQKMVKRVFRHTAIYRPSTSTSKWHLPLAGMVIESCRSMIYVALDCSAIFERLSVLVRLNDGDTPLSAIINTVKHA